MSCLRHSNIDDCTDYLYVPIRPCASCWAWRVEAGISISDIISYFYKDWGPFYTFQNHEREEEKDKVSVSFSPCGVVWCGVACREEELTTAAFF